MITIAYSSHSLHSIFVMRISLNSVSKAFGHEQVIRECSHVFEPGSRTAILGPNGSGKSTLLQLVGGVSMPTAGSVTHECNGLVVAPEFVYRQTSIAAPYMSLYEELPLREAIAMHAAFKPLRAGVSANELAGMAMLEKHVDKPVRDLSSGMKQRLKLVLAIGSDSDLLLLDEPTSNLDANGTGWFKELLAEHLVGRTLVVASNRAEAEILLCTDTVEVERWKQA